MSANSLTTIPEPAPPSPGVVPAGARPRWVRRLGDGRSWLRAAPMIILAAGAWSHRWVTEDAFINFRVVDMTLAGHPLVFNVGERVEAATSPLWLWMLILLQATVGHVVDLAWLSLLVGLGLSLCGLAAAVAASVEVLAARRPGALAVPAGALVLAVLPPMWDFATSGLETGLTFCWLGGSYLLLVRRRSPADAEPAARRRPDAPWWVPLVLGLGPLIRPDLTLYSALFLAVLLIDSRPGWMGRARALALALALPAAYQLFRMAYFASLVPNPALAKEAGVAEWARGLAYVKDLAGPYLLVVPLLALAAWTATAEWGAAREGWRATIVRWCPALGGAVHAVYIVRVGGDFMHARLLLPALFAALAPVAMLPVERRRPGTAVAAAVVTAWSVLCLASLRVPLQPEPGVAFPVVDERAYWNRLSADDHAITMPEHAELHGVRRGLRARELAAQGADAYLPADPTLPELTLPPGTGVVLDTAVLGLGSTAAGLDVRALDAWGLAEAFGSHIERDPQGRVGHQKALPFSYRLALFPELLSNPPMPPDPDELAAARRVVACPAVQRLIQATRDPLTPGRALTNLVQAPSLSRLRIPRDPREVTDCRQLG